MRSRSASSKGWSQAKRRMLPFSVPGKGTFRKLCHFSLDRGRSATLPQEFVHGIDGEDLAHDGHAIA